MILLIISALLLLTADASPDDSFFISAPNVFHEGVEEKVFVQLGKNNLNKDYVIYLKHEIDNSPVSKIQRVEYGQDDKGVLVNLMVNQTLLSALPKRPTHLMLVAESSPLDKHMTRVLLSPHRGYIFIQTNQPVYKPMGTVQYRIFTLDHTFRPSTEHFHLSVYNAAGHRVLTSKYISQEGLFKKHFVIPDVAKTGTWKVTAHYEGDAANAVSKEFNVQKFVMPTFDVDIQMEHKFVLVKATEMSFTILARYSHANSVNGGYHCQFGVIQKGSKAKPDYIRGMEQTGSVKDGIASLSVNISKLNKHLEDQQNLTLSDMEKCGKLLYLGVFVTDIQNGEIQEQQISLPVVTNKYEIDLSRTRSHFIPGFPINLAVLVRLPDGSPAEKIPVTMTLWEETRKSQTSQQGAVFSTFNAKSTSVATLTVSVDDSSKTKVINAAVSPTDSYLYLGVDYKEYRVGDPLRVGFTTKNAPNTGVIHYLVMSRGSIILKGHVELREASGLTLQISDNMVPSFRLIGYFYTQNNDIISDSVWLAVKGTCEDKVKVELKGPFEPGTSSKVDIDLYGQEATVALLAVDTALYSLNTDNKLTSEQVYSSMEAYDLGCSYGGGADAESVMADAGLAFFTKNKAKWRNDLNCHSASRQKRSVDLEQEMLALRAKYEGETLQSCCARGFLLIPMQHTCDQRAERVSKMQNDTSCYDAFLSCCREGQRLREQKTREEAKKGLGRTSSLIKIEDYFLNNNILHLRKEFFSSIAFTLFPVKGTTSYSIVLPDSITTWEIQVITLSRASGLCVTKPPLLRAFKPAFVSLRFPYSVRKYEQMYISPVIYNYGSQDRHVAVHMEQSEGLCSPGSATSASFVNITVIPDSSQMVTFSAVPMGSGSIPIRIRLYDINEEREIDAIEKPLNVWTEGVEKTEDATIIIHLNETNEVSRQIINGKLPDDTVPDSTSNIFITLEEDGFGTSHVRNLLTPESVASLIELPSGCLEQTTSILVPTAVAVRYLDKSRQWSNMPPAARDDALNKIEKGVDRILEIINTEKRSSGGYGSWPSMKPSIWLTSHVVKVLSLLGKQQLFTFGREGRKAINIPFQEITDAVRYLCSKQKADGSFGDAHPVLHRSISGKDRKAFMTAFVTLALRHSLTLMEDQDRSATENVISKATSYLWSNFNHLEQPLSVAITAYALSVHKDYVQEVSRMINWAKFEITDNSATAVETSAYALLTAVALKDRKQAHTLAHWLTTQENYLGGFYSSQDTLMALEALAEYELMEPVTSEARMQASFTVRGKNYVEKLHLENKVKVERDLKRFVGGEITADFKGHGKAKFKVSKVFHLMEPKDICNKLSIEVTVKGKVKYTAAIQENYDYYEDDDDATEQSDEPREARSAIEWFDIRTRRRRDTSADQTADHFVTYEVCVQQSPSYSLTGMAIVDITLLSGFVAEAEDLEALAAPPEQYISHFELSQGKVLIYLNKLVEQKQCFEFDAKQLYTVGLLQPAPASFYDYYEPSQKCTAFYSAPKRSKVISKLCSGDVCQCAERPCHKLQNTFGHSEEDGQMATSDRRQDHACFYPIVDYAFMINVLEVSEKNNFELYKTIVTDVLKMRSDHLVKTGSHRVFAKRRQCKNKLEVGTEYLIMGKDGSTTDSKGAKQYLLEASTWVEPKPLNCNKTTHTDACNDFNTFVEEFKISSCKQ